VTGQAFGGFRQAFGRLSAGFRLAFGRLSVQRFSVQHEHYY
jgi:hypothetical protein